MGWAVKSWSPTIGMLERPGRAMSGVGMPIETPVGTITSERMKPVTPRARRLITTPEMTWSTRNDTHSRAWSSATSPPVRIATPTDSQRIGALDASPSRA